MKTLKAEIEDPRKVLEATAHNAVYPECKKCGSVYVILTDHPGPYKFCRKCAAHWTDEFCFADPDVNVGDLVVVGSRGMSFASIWDYQLDPKVYTDEVASDPLYARLGYVLEVREDRCTVQSLRFPYIESQHICNADVKANETATKVGRWMNGVLELREFATFIYIEEAIIRKRDNFGVRLPNVRRQN